MFQGLGLDGLRLQLGRLIRHTRVRQVVLMCLRDSATRVAHVLEKASEEELDNTDLPRRFRYRFHFLALMQHCTIHDWGFDRGRGTRST